MTRTPSLIAIPLPPLIELYRNRGANLAMATEFQFFPGLGYTLGIRNDTDRSATLTTALEECKLLVARVGASPLDDFATSCYSFCAILHAAREQGLWAVWASTFPF